MNFKKVFYIYAENVEFISLPILHLSLLSTYYKSHIIEFSTSICPVNKKASQSRCHRNKTDICT